MTAWILTEASTWHEDQYVFVAVFSQAERATRFMALNPTYTVTRQDGSTSTLPRSFHLQETEMDPETAESPNAT